MTVPPPPSRFSSPEPEEPDATGPVPIARPAAFLSSARDRLTDAGLRTAGKGASALGRASDLVKRKLDERAAQQAATAPRSPTRPHRPAPPRDAAPTPGFGSERGYGLAPDPTLARDPAPAPDSTVARDPVRDHDFGLPRDLGSERDLLPRPAPAQRSQVVPFVSPPALQPTEILRPPTMSATLAQVSMPVTMSMPVAGPMGPSTVLAPGTRRKLNPAAVVAIIVAVLFPPAGIGLAKSARRECRESGERGGNLALVAHMIGAAGTTLLVLCVLAVASAFAVGLHELGSGIAGIGSFLGWIAHIFGG
jgi:hypothetical protein